MKENRLIKWLKEQAAGIDWKVLLFLLLVLNVKLVIKIAALVLLTVIDRKNLSLSNIVRQRYLWFYFGMTGIAVVNVLLQYKTIQLPYIMAAGMGILFWILAAGASYHAFYLVKRGEMQKINKAVTVFFLLHVLLIFFHLFMIMLEIGDLNPYTYKGLNNKYYMSTGDSISGITFDSPVTTAMIGAFGVLFFLYRRRFFYLLLCMSALIIVVSNLTNLFLVTSLIGIFIFRSDREQKSIIVVCIMMLAVFIGKISPQNDEYITSFLYKMVGKAYYLPPVKVLTKEDLKHTPDGLLSFEQQREKKGLLYIDSINETLLQEGRVPVNHRDLIDVLHEKQAPKIFNEYRPSIAVKEKENLFKIFLDEHYTKQQKEKSDSLYNWDKPGKEIAYKEVFSFLKAHPGKILLGTGIGNFSSRVAFKTTALNIAGSYPEKFRYIGSDFLDNHLYLFLYYHAQWQIKHTVVNTPDSVYNQLLSEYGIAGLLIFLFFYVGYYLRRRAMLRLGIPLLFVLLGAFFIEYWFEQLSIVILFELLMFIDIRSLKEEKHT